ncbi:Elf1-domain-containing protein [Aaosphaeria arxii CBS 175.79]|uniref:Transcription elongation factor 1 homolog n=1 Tax=Aaosphaeria arxii CBS 175.79 TaxID=1450172 RepID=A0A6A5XJ33_9PLEO|nr:Elf1-domain-containing protein [Aaosphaeria arxii CBS 175.79]KAF2012876.1 Elf1-domain-containing protein [Aaosphaeria arxii CBS 175.79]
MGKRKSAKKPQGPRKKERLNTTFLCLFCNHENSVSVTIDKKAGVGNLHCKVCGQVFQTKINFLSAPVDVYADWHDACDAVSKKPDEGAGRSINRTAGPPRPAAAAGGDDMDDFIENDEPDAEGEFDDDDI